MLSPEPRAMIHRIDGDDVIRYVDDGWIDFAAANDAAALTRERVLGRSLYDFIHGPEVRHTTALLLARVRSHRMSVHVPVRCDSPGVRRFIDLSLVPLNRTGIEMRSVILREEARAPIALLDPNLGPSEEFVRICSWCKRVFVEGQGWVEIEVAIASLDLLGTGPLPQPTHGMCPECLALVQQARA